MNSSSTNSQQLKQYVSYGKHLLEDALIFRLLTSFETQNLYDNTHL